LTAGGACIGGTIVKKVEAYESAQRKITGKNHHSLDERDFKVRWRPLKIFMLAGLD
jgi:hypothetical protein